MRPLMPMPVFMFLPSASRRRHRLIVLLAAAAAVHSSSFVTFVASGTSDLYSLSGSADATTTDSGKGGNATGIASTLSSVVGNVAHAVTNSGASFKLTAIASAMFTHLPEAASSSIIFANPVLALLSSHVLGHRGERGDAPCSSIAPSPASIDSSISAARCCDLGPMIAR